MAAIIYTDDNKKFDFSLMSRINPTKAYINHVENYFYLRFILDKSDNFVEKNQANKEILIAEKKMLFWKRNKDFRSDIADKAFQDIRKKWSV
jgi:hypothetical protein